MRHCLFILLTLVSFNVFTSEGTDQHNLHNLISHEMRMLQNLKKKDERFSYREIELYYEKFLIVFKQEIHEKINANKSLSEAILVYRKIKKKSELFFKLFPKSKFCPEILYLRAVMSRDLGLDQESFENLQKGMELIFDRKSIVFYNISVGLGDYFYNKKLYQKAINFYEGVLDFSSEEWSLKNRVNLSWCYFKTKEFSKALNLLENTFLLNSGKYVDHRRQVIETLAVFYSSLDKIERGINFFSSQQVRDPKVYISLFSNSLKIGLLNSCHQLIQVIEKMDLEGDQYDLFYDLVFQFYSNFKLVDEAALWLKKVEKFYIAGPSQPGKSSLLISLQSLIQHIVLPRNEMLLSKSLRERKKTHLAMFFETLLTLDEKNSQSYLFSWGERLAYLGEFLEAWEIYKRLLSSFSVLKSDIKDKAFDSIFKLTSDDEFPKVHLESVLLFTFKKYLSIHPEGSHRSQVLIKLINLFLKLKKDEEAFFHLKLFKNDFPQDKEKIVLLVDLCFDQFGQHGKTELLSSLIFLIKSENYFQSSDQISTFELKFGNYLFESFTDNLAPDKIPFAIEALTSIFYQKNFPLKIKVRSALMLAKIHLDLSEIKQSLSWLLEILAITSPEETVQIIEKLVLFAEEFQRYQDFKSSIKILGIVIEKIELLNQNFKIDSSLVVKNYISSLIAEDDSDKLISFLFSFLSKFENGFSDQSLKLAFFYLLDKCDFIALEKFLVITRKNIFFKDFEEKILIYFFQSHSFDEQMKLINLVERLTDVTFDAQKLLITLKDFLSFKTFLREKNIGLKEILLKKESFSKETVALIVQNLQEVNEAFILRLKSNKASTKLLYFSVLLPFLFDRKRQLIEFSTDHVLNKPPEEFTQVLKEFDLYLKESTRVFKRLLSSSEPFYGKDSLTHSFILMEDEYRSFFNF
jgi:tetratricopeptide (TPR) repeat protein